MSEVEHTIIVTVDLAPDDEQEFREWCAKQGFNYVGGPRRAWCSEFGTYFRNAAGVADHRYSGGRLLFYEDDSEATQ